MIDFLVQNDVARFLALIVIFFVVMLVVVLVTSVLGDRQATRERLDMTVSAPGAVPGGSTLRGDETRNRWIKIVNRIEEQGLSLVDTKDETLRKRLVAAGFTSEAAPRVYTLIRLALVITLPVLLIVYMWLAGSNPGLFKLYFGALIAMLAGLYLPSLFIRAKADRRQEEIVNGFPDALDLMLVCVEAGLGLETAFGRVGQEMARSHPLLAEQFGAVVLELRAGRSREDALRRMADRAGVDEIRAFATLLIQSTKLGSSIATTLRTYASEMREKRRMRAEERAHRLPVLLSVPLVGCMLPVMIGVLMVPAMIRLIRVLIPALG
ncbi:type II secretion system F family protein [Sphingomicrobium lutaoense]|uniref:Tight adherence protein C n=1 Tax=Sphingomicrobium lutaoense TaxID=515949 RepID=A0A839Z095_9SPHN|nr:type II secretion system F family protein [Sphingomicrobium lutaoense]MBB3764686.1 tight adherence protein C [Sphingomicrobium lutaoense]